MKIRKVLLFVLTSVAALLATAQTGSEPAFRRWALTPPMGWNSWDCYGPTVVEAEVKANADYMATHLADKGWQYVVVDIRWFVENDKAGGYNQTNPIYVIDEFGRYTPALNRFPSAAGGIGFKALADYVHDKGLKFGIHLMRGIPKKAVEQKLPVLGTDGITCDMIANNDSTCTWLRDNMKVDWRKAGAQEYYNSCFDMYADWGVDFVKIDDLSRPYHTAEIEMIRHAIDHCGRPIVLSVSPGETPLEEFDHVSTHANMWRTVDDFWDNWSQLGYQFQVCAKWAPYIQAGAWPDADMLPLGKISIRGERGSERWTAFTADEQRTMMTLWTIFRSPLMFGGDMPQNDDATNALLTNDDVLYMHAHSANNRQVSRDDASGQVVWSADDPATGDKFVALFNVGGNGFVDARRALYRSGTISYLTTVHSTEVDVALPDGTTRIALVVTDGGDSFDCDHADWISPVVTLANGTTVDLTGLSYVKGTTGWGDIHINTNIEGGSLSINGTSYDKGIATHANSVIVYDLPSAATRFTALAGIDNTGSNQGSRSSVEFMVFDYDPTDPSIPAQPEILDAVVDLDAVGIGADMECAFTDMWTGQNVGTYKGHEYGITLQPHASALYRVSPQGRKAQGTLTLTAGGAHTSGEPFEITAQLTSAPADDAYISMLCNGEIVATLRPDADGKAVYTACLTAGQYSFEAVYSGTDRVLPVRSAALVVTVDGETADLSMMRARVDEMLGTADGLSDSDIPEPYGNALRSAVAGAQAYATMGEAELTAASSSLTKALEDATLAMYYVVQLKTVINDGEELADNIKDGELKTELMTALATARAMIAGGEATLADYKAQISTLSEVVARVRLSAEVADGSMIEVTDKIVNPSFEDGTTGWSVSNSVNSWQDFSTWGDRPAAHGTMFVSVASGAIVSLDMYQDIRGLPTGKYRLEGSLRNTESINHITNQRLYARVGTSTVESEPLTTISGDNNNDWTRLSIDGIELGEGKALRIGARSSGDGTTNRGWFHADDFRLYYLGTTGIAEVEPTFPQVTLKAVPGGVEVCSQQPYNIRIYHLDGTVAASLSGNAGQTTHAVAAGVYVAQGVKLIVP